MELWALAQQELASVRLGISCRMFLKDWRQTKHPHVASRPILRIKDSLVNLVFEVFACIFLQVAIE